jgi:hypothetical protein
VAKITASGGKSEATRSIRNDFPDDDEALEHHQPADVTIQERQGGIDHRVIDRPDRGGFPGHRPSTLQPGDRRQRLVDRRGDQFLGRRPLEDPPHPADPLVDQRPAPLPPDHRRADRLECQRPELPGRAVAVQLPDQADDQLVLVNLVRLRPVLTAVVLLSVPEEGQEDLVYRRGAAGRTVGRGGSELDEELFVIRLGFGTAPSAERPGAADAVLVDVEDGAALVSAGLGNCVSGTRHSNHPRIAGLPAKPRLSSPRSRPPGGKLNCFGGWTFRLVGRAGIEPAT